MSKQTNKRDVIIIMILIVITIASAGYKMHQDHQQPITQETAGQEQIDDDPAKPTDEPNTDPSVSTDPDSGKTDKTPTQYEGESANKSKQITGQITYIAINNKKLSVRVSIDQFLKNSGTCSLELIKNKKVVTTVSAPTLDDASSSTCQGFDIDVSKLEKGNYTINIKITAGSKTGTLTGKVSV